MEQTPIHIPHAYGFRQRASGSGFEYRIAIAEPPGPPPPSGFPIVYLLDADATFGTLVEAIRARARRPDATGVGPAIVVGIMHGQDDGGAQERRRRDYADGPQAFADFLEQDLKPAVEARVRVDRRVQVLFGHSLAGYFALWTLLSRGDAFNAVVAVSPSIWWNPDALYAKLRDSRANSAKSTDSADGDMARRVMITVGEYEARRAPWQPDSAFTDDAVRRREERRMIAHARDMATALAKIDQLTVDFKCFAGEDHASVIMLSVARALRFVLPPACLLTPDASSSD
jgi:predicted alpha/beta superfamily hydrolase